MEGTNAICCLASVHVSSRSKEYFAKSGMSMTGGYIQQREFVLPSTVCARMAPAKKHRIHIKSALQSLPQRGFIIIIYRLASTGNQVHDLRARQTALSPQHELDADIVAGFCTGFARGSELVMEPRLVALHYLRTWFAVDVLASLPFDTLAFARPATARQLSRDFKVLRLLKLFKIFRMLKILRVEGLLHDLCDQGWLTPAVARLCSVVFAWLYVTHFIACMFWGVARLTESDWNSQVAKWRRFAPPQVLRGGSLARRLLFAYHWAILDRHGAFLFHPVARPSPVQSTFLIFTRVVSIAFVAVIIGQAKSVMEELSSEDPDKKAQMKILERYLDRHGVPSDTRLAARSHFVFLHNRLLTSKFRALFADLPLELRSRLEASARVPALNRCAMFGPARRTGAQVAVARAMVNAVYGPMEPVFAQGDAVDGVRVVAHGRLFTFMRCVPWPKLLFFAGSYATVGEDCALVFAARVWLYGCSAQSHTEAYVVPVADLVHLLEDYRDLRPGVHAAAAESYRRLAHRVAGRILVPKLRALLFQRRGRPRALPRSGGAAATSFRGVLATTVGATVAAGKTIKRTLSLHGIHVHRAPPRHRASSYDAASPSSPSSPSSLDDEPPPS